MINLCPPINVRISTTDLVKPEGLVTKCQDVLYSGLPVLEVYPSNPGSIYNVRV